MAKMDLAWLKWIFEKTWNAVTTLSHDKLIHEINNNIPLHTKSVACSTITRHQEDKLSKATNSLFPIKMIAILEWT